MQYCFDEMHSPDLLHVPLKGKYLAEVGTQLREQRDAMIRVFGAEFATHTIKAGGFFSALTAMAEYCSDPKAQQFGLSQSEAETIINQLLADPMTAVRDLAEQLRNAGLSVTPAKIDALENSAALNIRGAFSACVAAQEHREADYKRMLDDYFAEVEKVWNVHLPEFRKGSDEMKLMRLAGMQASVQSLEEITKSHQSRRSPSSDLSRYMTDKSRELYENFVENIFKIDIGTKAGKAALQEKLRLIEQTTGKLKTVIM